MADAEARTTVYQRGPGPRDGCPATANSGHPGTAMALAPLAHVLFTRVLRHDPSRPDWPDRDRFILSNGHASILLYSMLFLNGYGLELKEIEQFRQWGSRTPGHPEVTVLPGVEVTTGPLGQGFANGVGMGVAERFLRKQLRAGADRPPHLRVLRRRGSDGRQSATRQRRSPGKLGLGRLVYVFDDNHITIDGSTDLATIDDVTEAVRGLRLARRATGRGGERSRRPRGRPSPRHGRG